MKSMHWAAIFSVLISFLNAPGTNKYEIESELKSRILKNYNKTIRPNETVYVLPSFEIYKIIQIDEVREIMQSSAYFFLSWQDSRLKWEPIEHNNISELFIPITELWKPDMYVINSADSSGFVKFSETTLARIGSDAILWINIELPLLNTRCQLNIYKYPYDTQECSIQIGSWFHPKEHLSFIENKTYPIDSATKYYVENSIWKLENSSISFINSGSRWLYFKNNSDFFFNLTLKRQADYYMINFVFPCFILNFINLCLFFIPFTTQSTMTLTSFLTMSTNALRISSQMPVQSNHLPLITHYFFLSLLYSLISFVWFFVMDMLKSKKSLPVFLVRFIMMMKRRKNKVQSISNNETYEFDECISFLNEIAFTLMFLIMSISFIAIWTIITS